MSKEHPFLESTGDCSEGCGDNAICGFCTKYNRGRPRNYYPSDPHPRVVVIDEDAESGRPYKYYGEFLYIDGKFVNVTESEPAIVSGVLIEKKKYKLCFSIHGKEITIEEFKSNFPEFD